MPYLVKFCGIYCIRNTISGKVYVGSAADIRARWYSHRYLLRRGKHHSPTFQHSWNKHGSAAFSYEILEHVSDPSALPQREQYWMDELKSCTRALGFNVLPTAGSPLGYKHSPATLAKRSIAFKGKKRPPFTPAWRANIAAAKIGTTASDATKAKMSATRKGRPLPPMTDEHKRKIGAANRGRKNPAVAESNRLRKINRVLALQMNAIPDTATK